MTASRAAQAALAAHRSELPAEDVAFFERVHASGIDPYVERLAQYGFARKRSVLDAGCGFGQWALALARLNERVTACDASERRVKVVAAIAREEGESKIHTSPQDLCALGYPTASFDAVFCYGVLFLTDWRRTLRELARVLEPRGLLYVNANGFGWYKHLWLTQHNKSEGYDPRSRVASTLANTVRYAAGEAPEVGMDLIIEPDDLRSALDEAGFDEISVAEEGCLGAGDLARAHERSFFRGSYGGDLGVYEMLARRTTRP